MLNNIIKKELAERRILIAIGAVLVILPRLSIHVFQKMKLIGNAGNSQLFAFSWSVFQLFLEFFIILACSSYIAGEIKKKNIEFLFSLPVSKSLIWTGKFLSAVILIYGILLFFALVNYPMLNLGYSTFYNFRYDSSPWILAVLMLPMLFIAFTFLISSLMDREINAASASFVLLILLRLFVAFITRYILWDPTLFEGVFVIVVLSAGFAAISWFVFCNSEMMDNTKMKFSNFFWIPPSIILLYIIAIVPLFFISTFKSEENIKDLRLLGIFSREDYALCNPSFRNSGDSRLWLVPLKTAGKIIKIPVRYCMGTGFSPSSKRTLIYQGVNNPGPWGTLLKYDSLKKLFIYDMDTGKTFAVEEPQGVELREGHQWIDDESLVAIDNNYDSRSKTVITTFYIFDSMGRITKTFDVSEKWKGALYERNKISDDSIRNVRLQVLNGEIFLFYGIDLIYPRTYYEKILVKKIDPHRGAGSTVFVKTGEEGARFGFSAYAPISPDGKKIIYSNDKGESFAVDIHNPRTSMAWKAHHMSWIGYKNILKIACRYDIVDNPPQKYEYRIMIMDFEKDRILYEHSPHWAYTFLNMNTARLGILSYKTSETHKNKQEAFVQILDLSSGETTEPFALIEDDLQKRSSQPYLLENDDVLFSAGRKLIGINPQGEGKILYPRGENDALHQ